jgi:hypothetical protein
LLLAWVAIAATMNGWITESAEARGRRHIQYHQRCNFDPFYDPCWSSSYYDDWLFWSPRWRDRYWNDRYWRWHDWEWYPRSRHWHYRHWAPHRRPQHTHHRYRHKRHHAHRGTAYRHVHHKRHATHSRKTQCHTIMVETKGVWNPTKHCH